MADNCYFVVSGLIVVGSDSAAEFRRGLKGLKEIAIYARGADALRA
jgi:hypothetical protein